MASKEAFDKSLKIPKAALIMSGITIYPTENKLFIYFMNFIFYINIPWLYAVILGEFYWLVQGTREGKSLGELSFIAPCATFSILATVKIMSMYMYQDEVKEIVAKLRNLHPEENELNIRTKNTGHNNDEVLDLGNLEREDEIEIVKDSMKFLNIVVVIRSYSRLVDETKVSKGRREI